MNAEERRLIEGREKSMDILCRDKVAQARKEALRETVELAREKIGKYIEHDEFGNGRYHTAAWIVQEIEKLMEDEDE